MQIYNTFTDTWRSEIAMPSIFGRGSLSAVHANGIIYFCGGIANKNTVNSCGTYSMVTNTFGAMASMPQGVNHAAAATDGTKVYIAGGR